MNAHFKRFAAVLVMCSFAVGLPGWVQAEMARYNVDLDHTILGFEVAHMAISKVTGRFMDYSGFVMMDPEKKEFKTIEAVIQTKSLDTRHEKRNEHLRSPDFFNVEKFPTMTYKMKSSKKTEDGTYTAVGDLTLAGVTKEITLVGRFNGTVTDPGGDVRAGFTASGTLNRKDFGMKWNKLLDNGGAIVGDTVTLKLEIETIKEKKKG